MAKPTISKGKKGPSKHSRASRREEPIDINTDKSLKTVLPPVISTDHHRPAVLAAQLASSVSKPTRKTGRKAQLSSRARKRQERSIDMAEAVMERTFTKRQKSLGHAKVINTRRKPWEEINNEVFGEEEKAKKLTKKQLEKQREDEVVKKFFEEGADKDEDGNVEMEGASEDEVVERVETAQAMEQEVL
ncbi:Alb1-domain-containing protein [Cercophora samala]|uniref:Alb1-domain-containing protein n=1 Tax=Cercophora samala TaxID=330535 RepID=A0AA39ZAK4_9PEZI|nr:Alb1-domain-containing protein [Cercophora samala]